MKSELKIQKADNFKTLKKTYKAPQLSRFEPLPDYKSPVEAQMRYFWEERDRELMKKNQLSARCGS